jgi:hypothetical protein
MGADGDVGSGEAAAVDQGGVDVGVGDDRRLAAGQGGDRTHVGQEAGGEHQRRRRSAEAGQLVFQLGVQVGGAGDQAGAGRAGSPAQGGRGGRAADPFVAGQAQVVVAGQVEQVRVGLPGPKPARQPGGPALRGVHIKPVENSTHDWESDRTGLATRSRPRRGAPTYSDVAQYDFCTTWSPDGCDHAQRPETGR